jgi:hypothetical protein
MGQLFVDMDGVLADFNAHYESVFGVRPCKVADNVDWAAVRARPDFFLGIPPMPDMGDLWRVIKWHSPIVLTGVPASVEEAAANKRAWVSEHLGSHVEVRCCRSSQKSLHAQPGDILIDDWEKYRKRWIRKGGIWITHRSASETIVELGRVFADAMKAAIQP